MHAALLQNSADRLPRRIPVSQPATISYSSTVKPVACATPTCTRLHRGTRGLSEWRCLAKGLRESSSRRTKAIGAAFCGTSRPFDSASIVSPLVRPWRLRARYDGYSLSGSDAGSCVAPAACVTRTATRLDAIAAGRNIRAGVTTYRGVSALYYRSMKTT